MSDSLFSIRHAVLDDAEAIAEIYNEAILTTTATFDTEPKSAEDRLEWLKSHDERHPVFVAEVAGKVVGWGALNSWSDRPAYNETAETSFYVAETFRGRGIGRALKERLIEEARRLGFYTLLARAAEDSRASIHLNESCGFRLIGTMKEVGFKFGRRLDVHVMQLMLQQPKPEKIVEMGSDEILRHNRLAWDRNVENGNRWTQPVSSHAIERARCGEFELLLTPTKPVPLDWFPELNGAKILCLASAGGQQAPLLAAAGANVTVFDNSPKQLAQDRAVAERDGLQLDCVDGDMADLSVLPDESFDLIFHPCSNVFVPDVNPVWKECHRVLRPGGLLLAGFTNPVRYLFDDERKENRNLEVRYPLPYSDLIHLPSDVLQTIIDAEQPLEFGHTLEDQIGGQLKAGFMLSGFYEDRYSEEDDILSRFMATFIATRGLKP